MYIYKAYHWPTCTEYFFTKHPSPSLLEKQIGKEYEDSDWEVTKVDVVNNKNGSS